VEAAKGKLTSLLALWHDKRGSKAMPSRDDFPVQALRPWLGNLALIDLRDGGTVFRLCGTSLHSRFAGEVTRKDLAALDDGVAVALRDCIDQVRKSRQPCRAKHRITGLGYPLTYHEICLPLAGDGVTMDTVLFASFPEQRK
jgi:hypothetical protein